MIVLILFLICLFTAIGSGVIAAASDIRGLVIDNVYSVAVGLSFFAAYAALSLGGPPDVFGSLWSHLGAGLIAFAVTAAMFGARMMGAADSKLLTVYALWMGTHGLGVFVLYTALAGGILALVALGIKKTKLFKAPRAGGWIARLQDGENKVPYGVAIAGGAVASFVKFGYLSPEF